MYVDSQSQFSNAQAVTSTAISENVLDLNAASNSNVPLLQDIGTGQDVYLVVQTAVTATDTGSDATLAVTLESDSTANLATSPTVHLSTGALAFAAYATAGTVIFAGRLPAGAYERYLGLRYTVASGPLTAGAFTAFLTLDIQSYRYYASSFRVDS